MQSLSNMVITDLHNDTILKIACCCRGVEDISKLRNVIDLFESRGYSSSVIEKVLGLNVLRVLNDVLN